MTAPVQTKNVTIVPATAERWPDIEKLFGTHGASAGCWCMFWRLPHSQFKELKGEGNKAILRSMTLNNQVPGVLAYLAGNAIGWCSIGPRGNYAALAASRILKRIDDQPVWSVACFFVNKLYRQIGISRVLLEGAIGYAQTMGAKIIEGYPIDMQVPQLQGQTLTGYSGYMGIASVYRSIGFVEVGRASATQIIMRFFIEPAPPSP